MAGNFWGGLIKGLREEQGISQRILADRTQVNRSTLRKIEAGKTSGDIDTIERVLSYLGCELEALQSEAQRVRRDEMIRDPGQRSRFAMRNILSLKLS